MRETIETSDIPAAPDSPSIRELGLRMTPLMTPRALAVAAFILAIVVVLFYKPFSDPAAGDKAIYDYISQSIVRGEIPYRDAADPKMPGSMYLSALAIAVGRVFGSRDVIAIRWLYILMIGILASLTYVTAKLYFRSWAAAAMAFLIPLMIGSYLVLLVGGTQPKLPLMVFGLVTLIFIAEDKPFWCGFASTLAFLCWQPGLLFTGVAVLVFSRYLTSWRDLRALKVIAGALIPVMTLILYFYWRHALADLWSWTMVYPFTVFAPEENRPLGEAVIHFWSVVQREFHGNLFILVSSLGGLLLYAAGRIRARIPFRERDPRELFRDALLFPPLIYLAFCIINFQGSPDLIPFFPFIGLFSGYLIDELARLVAGVRLGSRFNLAGLRALIVGLAITTILAAAIIRAVRYERGKWTLADQELAAREIAGHIGPEDKMYVHAAAEVLLLLNRPNLNRFIAFDAGVDEYVASARPGGFQDVLEDIEEQKPKIVVMARLRNVNHRQELEQWVAEHYDSLDVHGYRNVYIRKQQ